MIMAWLPSTFPHRVCSDDVETIGKHGTPGKNLEKLFQRVIWEDS